MSLHPVPAAGSNPLQEIGNFFNLLRLPFEWILGQLYHVFAGFGPTAAIGAYGVSLVVLTLLIKTALFPLFQTQLKLTKKSQAEQRKIAPEMAALRKKHKGDPQKLNTEMMALYKEHGINPLSSAAGCLPVLAQMPILIGLYRAFADSAFFKSLHGGGHFLWIKDLSKPNHVDFAHLNQLDPILLILPLLAGLTTYVQSKMFQPPIDPNADDQTQQMAQVTSSMSLIMPLFITYLALQPAIAQGLVLYWVVSNLFSIGQQYFVNGWGQLPFLGTRSLPPAPPGNDRGKPAGKAPDKPAGKGGDDKRSKVLVGQTAMASRRGRRR
ncbi:MAG TPA: YidC/Oxa1 family membrane protein insertase [Candidatus Dormibacteraeota bacterium]|nr:YidC/Oxa1 family membrane protein insertase [Candidatus Dormibacteraeota bacterium]